MVYYVLVYAKMEYSQMDSNLRKEKYRIGILHGKIHPQRTSSEAQIQLTVYLTQRINICRKRNESTFVRILGYELPLKKDCKRGKCIDLVGYDKDHNLYIIELKKKSSSERISKIRNQIIEYGEYINQIRPYLEKEFYSEYHFPIKFKAIKKIILAPLEFYNHKDLIPGDIEYAYFADKNIERRKPGGIINIHLVRM